MEEIILKLYSLGAIRFGSFEIKKDFFSPFEIDFSKVISHPELSKKICQCLWEKGHHLKFQLICGVPLFGANFANFLAWNHNVPLIITNNETKQMVSKIQGSYKSGDRCLLIQDKHVSGQHTLHLIEDLEEEGITVQDIVSFVDMELGGKKKIKSRGYVPHDVFNISEILQILFDAGKLPGDQFKLTTDFLENV